jgi:hypothetical protein
MEDGRLMPDVGCRGRAFLITDDGLPMTDGAKITHFLAAGARTSDFHRDMMGRCLSRHP